jgi:gliding motility associated protien GldN
MKRLKFYLSVAVLFSILGSVQAQQKLSEDSTQLFFDDFGTLTQIKVEPQDVAKKFIKINPRIDDIAWQKKVLRVIDLRELQNRPLYYPSDDMEPTSQKNLFAIIYSHVLDGTLTAYKSQSNPDQTYVPTFTPENVFNVEEHLDATNLRYLTEDNVWARVNWMAQGVVKYYLQIVTYFDKSTSEFKSKIIAIAPLYDERYNAKTDIRTSVFFWVSFEQLRPFLMEEFVKMSGRNTTPIIDFDYFLVNGEYDSYIIKDYDVTGKDIDKDIKDPLMIRQEQDRIEAEILNFEQDLWSY